jgi:hypothetical protein
MLHAGVWDDSQSWHSNDFGGHCVLDKPADAYSSDKDVEVVSVQLAHDGSLTGFPGEVGSGVDLNNLTISCVRPARNYRLVMMKAFNEECMEDIDEPLFAEYMHAVRFCVSSCLLHCAHHV